MILPTSAHLATPRLARRYEFTNTETDEYTITRSYLVRQDGILSGCKGYFIADLSSTVTMDISGDDIERGRTSDSWKHCYLPIEQPAEVLAGDRITLTFSRTGHRETTSFGQRHRWTGSAIREHEVLATFDHRSGTAG